jgi:site-specific recombinase XerC
MKSSSKSSIRLAFDDWPMVEEDKPTGCVRRHRIKLRHTAGTSLANAGVNLSYVRDTLGHGDLSTTSIYVHGEDDARHAAVSGVHRISWDSAGSS